MNAKSRFSFHSPHVRTRELLVGRASQIGSGLYEDLPCLFVMSNIFARKVPFPSTFVFNGDATFPTAFRAQIPLSEWSKSSASYTAARLLRAVTVSKFVDNEG